MSRSPAFLPSVLARSLKKAPPLPCRRIVASPLHHHHHHPFLPAAPLRRPFHAACRRVTTMSSTTSSSALPTPSLPASIAGRNPVFAQCMLRITNPTASTLFYRDRLGMTFLTRLDFADLSFSLLFFGYPLSPPPPMHAPQPQRAAWLWAQPIPTVELTWNWPRDSLQDALAAADAGEKGDEPYVTGARDPRGFGHLGLVVNNLPSVLDDLRAAGIPVLHDLHPAAAAAATRTAVVADPDGYAVQLAERPGGAAAAAAAAAATAAGGMAGADPVFAWVMLRVKDPREALPFFARLGFSLTARVDDAEARRTAYYMAYTDGETYEGDAAGAMEWMLGRRECALRLVHEWGTEEAEEQMYTNGNTKPYRGFGHVGIIVDDIYATVEGVKKEGYKVVREAGPFKDAGELAFVAEPSTDYWVEVIKRSGERRDKAYAKPVEGA